MAKVDIVNVFFREKPTNILLEIKRNAKSETYASNLAKAADCTYSHVVKILKQMHKADLIKFDRQGRLKLLYLTKKGEEFANHLEKIMTVLKD